MYFLTPEQLEQVAPYFLWLFSLDIRYKIIGIIILNLLSLTIGFCIATLYARGLFFHKYCKKRFYQRKRVDKENIDNFPEGFFHRYAIRKYTANLVIIFIAAALYIVETVCIQDIRFLKPGMVFYISLFFSHIAAVPAFGKKSLLRMLIDEEGYREYIKTEKKEKEDSAELTNAEMQEHKENTATEEP